MKIVAAIVMAALAGCGGGPGGGADGGGGAGGDGGTPTPCTIAISGSVTQGTYHSCLVSPAPQGINATVQVDGFSLPGCNDCRFIADFSRTPTDTCAGTGASIQIIDPSLWPDAIGMEASTTGNMSSCTITTSQLDLAAHHWSGTVDAVVVATDPSFNTVGYAHVTVTGGL